MLKLEQICLPVKFTDIDIIKACDKILHVGKSNYKKVKILRLSIDARKKPNIKYVASVVVLLKKNLEKHFKKFEYIEKNYSKEKRTE